MRKIIAFFLMLTLLLSCAAFPATAENLDTAVVTSQFSLRKAPDTAAQKGANLKQGTKMLVIEYTDDVWCLVKGANGRWKGYAKRDWLRITPVENSDTVGVYDRDTTVSAADPVSSSAAPEESAEGDAAGDADVDASRADVENPMLNEIHTVPGSLYVEPVKAGKPYEATPSKYGVSIGETDSEEAAYECYTLTKFSIRDVPTDDSKRLREVKKGSMIYVLAYGDDWCKVRNVEGTCTGYAKTKWLYRFRSYDRFNYEIPGWDGYRATGYVTMKVPVHITDTENKWKGNDICAGDKVSAQMMEDGTVRVILRREWIDLDPDTYEYTPFVNWREAKQGDLIGGYTVYYGKKQGGYAYPNRIKNITIAMKKMDNILVKKGEEYSYLSTVGPVNSGNGYKIAGITGGPGQGIGGGICHTASLTYDATLTLPFLVTERRPHTDEGTSYIPLEFDATVGVYSDFKFINTLPYDIRMMAVHCRDTCSISVWYLCDETVPDEELQLWRGDSLLYPTEAGLAAAEKAAEEAAAAAITEAEAGDETEAERDTEAVEDEDAPSDPDNEPDNSDEEAAEEDEEAA